MRETKVGHCKPAGVERGTFALILSPKSVGATDVALSDSRGDEQQATRDARAHHMPLFSHV